MSYIFHDLLSGGIIAQNALGTIAVASGGTNASSATGARTNLGLGDISTTNSNASTVNFLRGDNTWATPSASSVAAVDITGTVAISQGGTNAGNAAGARTNLGLGSLATQDSVAFVNVTGSVSLLTQSGLLPGATGLSGLVATANLGTGSATDAKFLKGDQTFDFPRAWPIGSVFIAVVDTNPNTLLGYGTWSTFAIGRTLVGFDTSDSDFNAAEKTGGAKTHTLTTGEMPSHTHTQDAHTHTQDAHTHTQNAHTHTLEFTTTATGSATKKTGTNDTSATGENTGSTTATNQATTATNQNATATNQNTGGGGAHNNVQPFYVVYFWKRTA